MIHKFWVPERSAEITMIIKPYGETVCFSVKPVWEDSSYTISVNQNIVDFKLFLLFVAGVFIFFYAKTVSQSPVFYYAAGTLLGILMTLVFVLLLVKSFIPKVIHVEEDAPGSDGRGTDEPSEVNDSVPSRVKGYVLIVGFVSFAVCYKRGPLVDPRSINLLTWTLRLFSLLLIYWGVSAPLFAFTATGFFLLAPGLRYPWKVIGHLRRKVRKWVAPEKLQVKLLTEDEYREQADAETSRALEELRRACRGPDFPSWLAVSRLQAPKKFADFVLGGSHVSVEEMSLHEEQYGLGGAFLEDQLFNLQTA